MRMRWRGAWLAISCVHAKCRARARTRAHVVELHCTCHNLPRHIIEGSMSIPPEPYQPRNVVFPKKVFGKSAPKGYSFQAKWFDTWKWLHWDDGKKTVLCHVCAVAWYSGKLTFSKNAESSFITKGFQNWKDATRIFHDHERSKCHTEAVERLVKLPLTTPDVGNFLVAQLAEEKRHNKEMLLHILRSIRFLAHQGLPLCGVALSNIVHVSEPDSNLHQLLELVSTYDTRVSEWIRKRSNKYTSPDISNEMLELMAHTILREIALQIRGRKFTIMVDETTDSSTKEQCVIVLRWVDNALVPHEDFIGLYDTPSANATNLVRIIRDVLLRLNISLEDCRGQCYDSVSVMQGIRSGVATQILAIQPKALYTHCYGHSLNLACQDMIRSIRPLRDALNTTFELSNLLKYSASKKAEYIRLQQEIAPSQAGFRNLCPTRWTVRASSLKSILDNYDVLEQSLEKFTEMSARDP